MSPVQAVHRSMQGGATHPGQLVALFTEIMLASLELLNMSAVLVHTDLILN